MRALTIIAIFIALSCSNRKDFLNGKWEIGNEEENVEFQITDDNRFTWSISGINIIDQSKFDRQYGNMNQVTIDIPEGKNAPCSRFTFIKQNENTLLVINYKCYINNQLVDEVFIAKRKNEKPIPIKNSSHETIILPEGFIGNFYITYTEEFTKSIKNIEINNGGIGEGGVPSYKQLFNSSRTFKYKNRNNEIAIVNPEHYGELYLKPNQILKYSAEDTVIIQLGYNQDKREDWIDQTGIRLETNENVEHFKCMILKDLKEFYAL